MNNTSLNILVICAHPDDETIGMGGTLKKMSKHHNIKVIFLSEGITARRKSGYVSAPQYDITHEEMQKMKKEIEVRKKHARKALKILGVQEIRFLDLPNQELDQIPLLKIIKEIEKEIFETKANLVEYLGSDMIIYSSIGGQDFSCKLSSKIDVKAGDNFKFDITPSSVHVFDNTTNKRV